MPGTVSSNTFSASGGGAITPSDTANIGPFRALYVGIAGNVAVRMAGDGSTLTFPGVTAGTVMPIQVDRVMATNTTAGSIIGLY